VTAHYNSQKSTLEPLVAAHSTRIVTAQANLTSEPDVVRLFDEATQKLGPVEVIVVNHAIYVSEDVPLKDMTLAQWERTMNSNLTSSFLVIREYLKRLEIAPDRAKKKAAIVLIGSTAGKCGEAGHADYSG
jgi:NAD(P)-dependent dehydrogenase (short-subunit alcohol dehydrogenase family)